MWLSLPWLLTLAASCGEPNPTLEHGVDLPLALHVDTVYLAGTLSDSAGYLDEIASVGFDGHGNLHVLDPGRYRIATWNSRGELVWVAGNHGDGPTFT